MAGAQQDLRPNGTAGPDGFCGCALAPGVDAAGTGGALYQNTNWQQDGKWTREGQLGEEKHCQARATIHGGISTCELDHEK